MNHHKILKTFLAFLATAIILLGGAGFWLYNGALTPAKEKIYNAIPYPAAFVNGSPVLMKDYLLRLNAAQNLPGFGGNPKNVYDELIKEEKTSQLAQARGLSVPQGEIDAEFQAYSSQPGFEDKLSKSGLSDNDFKSQIIKNQLVLRKLQIWFNSQKTLNSDVYGQAEPLLAKISNGEDMAALASGNSRDSTGKLLGGDLGYVNSATLLPELKEAVENLKAGEVKILTSRYGLHIIRLEGRNGNSLHLRQIFLPISGFDNWLALETQKLKTWNLIRLQ